MVGNFSTKFYAPIMRSYRSYLRYITNFYSIICNFDEVMPYLSDHPVHIMCAKWCHIWVTTQFTSCVQNVHHRPKRTLAFTLHYED